MAAALGPTALASALALDAERPAKTTVETAAALLLAPALTRDHYATYLKGMHIGNLGSSAWRAEITRFMASHAHVCTPNLPTVLHAASSIHVCSELLYKCHGYQGHLEVDPTCLASA